MNTQPTANSARPPFLLSAVRKRPYLYSAICKARIAYSRQIAVAIMREVFRHNQELLAPNSWEKTQVELLRRNGYTLAPDFFPRELIDSIYTKADFLFRTLQIDLQRA